MEWTNENIVKLIHVVEEHPVLWDVSNCDYKNSVKKKDLFSEFGKLFGCANIEVERKWKVIRGQYRREKQKEKESKASGVGSSDVYRPGWFAYSHLSFLHNSYSGKLTLTSTKPIQSQLNALIEESCQETEIDLTDKIGESVKEAVVSEIAETTGDEESQIMQKKRKVFKSPTKRKLNCRDDPRADLAYKMLQDIQVNRKRDEHDIFGEGVASKLRRIKNDLINLRVQRQIDNLLYDALMESSTYSSTSTTPVSSPFTSESSESSTHQISPSPVRFQPENLLTNSLTSGTTNYEWVGYSPINQ